MKINAATEQTTNIMGISEPPFENISVLKSGCRTGKKTGTGPNWTDGNRSTVAISGPVEFGFGCGCLDLENIKDRSKTGCDRLQPVFEHSNT